MNNFRTAVNSTINKGFQRLSPSVRETINANASKTRDWLLRQKAWLDVKDMTMTGLQMNSAFRLRQRLVMFRILFKIVCLLEFISNLDPITYPVFKMDSKGNYDRHFEGMEYYTCNINNIPRPREAIRTILFLEKRYFYSIDYETYLHMRSPSPYWIRFENIHELSLFELFFPTFYKELHVVFMPSLRRQHSSARQVYELSSGLDSLFSSIRNELCSTLLDINGLIDQLVEYVSSVSELDIVTPIEALYKNNNIFERNEELTGEDVPFLQLLTNDIRFCWKLIRVAIEVYNEQVTMLSEVWYDNVTEPFYGYLVEFSRFMAKLSYHDDPNPKFLQDKKVV